MKYIILFFAISSAFAEVSREILVRGKISGYFNDQEVKVIDNMGQTLTIVRSAFPKDFRMEQGKDFMLEIDPSQIKKFKPAKKQ